MMRFRYILVAIVLLGAVALAQNGEQVRQELEKTDRYIEQAEPWIQESGNENARQVFQAAKDLQRDAWDSHRQRQYARALTQTRAAQARVRQALELIKFDPQQVNDEIRRTAELMHDAEPVIRGSGIREALDLGQIALGEQEASRRNFDGRKYGLALKFTIAARQHTLKALDIIKRQGGRDRVRLELDRTDELLARAREKAGQVTDDRILELLARAEAWQFQAREAFRQGEILRAVKQTLSARDLLLRAWEMARGQANPELVREVIEETDRLMAEWRGEIANSGDKEAVSLLERAVERQASARSLYAAGRLGQSFQEATQARRLLNRAIEQVQSERVPPAPGGNERDD